MIDYKEYPEKAIVEISVEGHISSADFNGVVKKLEAFIARHEKIRMLEIVKSLDGVDPAMLWHDMGFAFRHMSSFSRCAVVTDTTWIKWWTSALAPFLRCEVKEFDLNEVDRAQEWLERPAQQQAA